MFEKSATELKSKTKLLRYKSIVNIVTFNVRTLNTINQLPVVTALTAKYDIDITICRQEHRYYHCKLELKYHYYGYWWEFVLVSRWKNFTNATIGDVEMLLSPRALRSLNSIERIQPRMMSATYDGNPCAANISCYSLTNARDEMDITIF